MKLKLLFQTYLHGVIRLLLTFLTQMVQQTKMILITCLFLILMYLQLTQHLL